MNFIRTNQLTADQINDLHNLETACRQHDGTYLTFSPENENLYFLLYDEGTLLSALSAFFDENDAECCAFTLPTYRRQGLFSRLLDYLTEESPDAELTFLTDGTCPDTIHTLKAIGAELWYQEHMMALELSEFCTDGSSDSTGFTIMPFPSPDNTSDYYTFLKDDISIGTCHIDFRSSFIYFYGFEIQEAFRHKGIGGACFQLLKNIIAQLPKDKRPQRIRLQVSGSNLPAMNLYKKAGFHITETLSCYLY